MEPKTVDQIEQFHKSTVGHFADSGPDEEVPMTVAHIREYCDNVAFLLEHIRKLEKRQTEKGKA